MTPRVYPPAVRFKRFFWEGHMSSSRWSEPSWALLAWDTIDLQPAPEPECSSQTRLSPDSGAGTGTDSPYPLLRRTVNWWTQTFFWWTRSSNPAKPVEAGALAEDKRLCGPAYF